METERRMRQASDKDVPAMARLWSEGGGEGGTSAERMARYLAGQHHPQQARLPRVMYVALDGDAPIGYIAGHLTRRYDCDGELQWVYVTPSQRRSGIASALLRRLAGWFAEQQAARVCVNVAPDNTAARRFYTRHGAKPLNEYWLVWDDIRSCRASGGLNGRSRPMQPEQAFDKGADKRHRWDPLNTD